MNKKYKISMSETDCGEYIILYSEKKIGKLPYQPSKPPLDNYNLSIFTRATFHSFYEFNIVFSIEGLNWFLEKYKV